jgi:hypothetical protein
MQYSQVPDKRPPIAYYFCIHNVFKIEVLFTQKCLYLCVHRRFRILIFGQFWSELKKVYRVNSQKMHAMRN